MSYTQVNITINKAQINTTNDLWNLSIVSLAANQQLLDIELKVYDENENTLYKAIKQEIVAQPNLTLLINPQNIGQFKAENNFPNLDSTKSNSVNDIPNGEYVLCISIFTHEPKIELNRVCDYIIVKNSIADSLLNAAKNKVPKPGFELHASIESFSYCDVNTNSGATSIMHRNSGFFVSPNVTVFGYPINMSIYYDTDSDFYYSNVPTFQFDFDTEKYQQILEDRLRQQLASKSGLSAEKYNAAMSLITSLEDVEQITSNPYFQQEIHRLDSLKVYEKYLNDSAAVALLTEKISSLDTIALAKLNNDSLCLDSAQVYAQMQTTKDSLLTIQDSITHSIAAAKELIEKAKRYRDIIENKQALEQKIYQDSSITEVKDYYDKFNNFDAATLTDPELVKDKLKNIDQLKKLEGFISGFDALQFGATVPSYSELSISGVLLNGLNVNYAIGAFNLIGVAGKINDNSTFFKPDREQNTYSKLYVAGYEQKVSENWTYGLYILQSDFNDADTLSYYNFLEKNNTLAGKFTGLLLKNKIKAEGEVAVSYAQNKDVIGFEDVNPEASNVSPIWLLQAFSQKDDLATGTFADKAGKLTFSGSILKGKTVLSLTGRYIGTGFYTPGNPFLLNDLMNVEFGVEQSLFKNKVSATAYIIKNRDNLDGLKEITTSYYNMRSGIKINIPKYPFLSIDYLPNVIINDFDQIQVNTLSVTSGYTYSIGQTPCIISVNFIDLKTLSSANDSSNFSSRYYNMLNNVNFKKFDLQTGFNYNEAWSDTATVVFSVFSAGTRFSATKWMDVYANLQFTGNANHHYEPGGQLELDLQALKNLKFKTGFYIYPESTLPYMTNIQNISNTSIYFSATYNF